MQPSALTHHHRCKAIFTGAHFMSLDDLVIRARDLSRLENRAKWICLHPQGFHYITDDPDPSSVVTVIPKP